MSVELIGLIAIAVGLIGIFRKPSFIIYVFVFSTLLGAAAGLILDSLGGASVSPAHLLLGFVVYRLVSDREIARGAINSIKPGHPGFWLAITVVYALATAYLLPRLFAGETFVFPVRAQNRYAEPLQPATSNVTQSVYFIGNLVCFAVMSGVASSRSGTRILLNATLATAVANLIFACLDLVTYTTNTAEIFSFIRNASYTIYADDLAAGFKRIIGSFAESSTFGSMTLGYFALTLRLWLLGVYPRFALSVTALSLLALLFATSTTAYVGLVLYLTLLYCELLVRMISGSVSPQVRLFIFGTPVVLALALIVIALNDASWAYFQSLLDTFVFNKLNTASGEERSAWNNQALQSFMDTYGFGVGNGSARASSFPVAALVSLGVSGTILFGVFFVGLFLTKSRKSSVDPLGHALQLGAKSTCLAWLISNSLANPQIDLGLAFFIFAAIACSRAAPEAVGALTLPPWKEWDSQSAVSPGAWGSATAPPS
jgi:hypothetical protein